MFKILQMRIIMGNLDVTLIMDIFLEKKWSQRDPLSLTLLQIYVWQISIYVHLVLSLFFTKFIDIFFQTLE